MRRLRWFLSLVCGISSLSGAGPGEASTPLPGPGMVEEAVVRLDLRLMSAAGGETTEIARETLELVTGTWRRTEMAVAWPRASQRCRVVVDALREGPEGEPLHRLHLRFRVEPTGASPIQLSRTPILQEPASSLVELHRTTGRSLLVAVRPEWGRRWVPRPSAAPGAPIAFRVEVVRLFPDHSAPLATSEVGTLLGQRATYAFGKGADAIRDTLELALTPRVISDTFAEVDVELRGSLSASEAGVLVDQLQTVTVARGESFDLDAIHGVPPVGYRIRVTALW